METTFIISWIIVCAHFNCWEPRTTLDFRPEDMQQCLVRQTEVIDAGWYKDTAEKGTWSDARKLMECPKDHVAVFGVPESVIKRTKTSIASSCNDGGMNYCIEYKTDEKVIYHK